MTEYLKNNHNNKKINDKKLTISLITSAQHMRDMRPKPPLLSPPRQHDPRNTACPSGYFLMHLVGTEAWIFPHADAHGVTTDYPEQVQDIDTLANG